MTSWRFRFIETASYGQDHVGLLRIQDIAVNNKEDKIAAGTRAVARMAHEVNWGVPLIEIQEFNQRGRDKWVIHKLREIEIGSKVLDVGAGTCPYRRDLNHCDYKSHDFAQYEGYMGPEGNYGRLDYVSDILNIPESDATFDAILCTEALEHVAEPIQAVGELTRLLRPGGNMLLTAPLGSGLHQEPFHFYGGFTPHWYRMVAGRFGLDVVEISPNGGFLKHLAQECIRMRWSVPLEETGSAPDAASLHVLFGEIIPRYFSALEDSFFDQKFTVGFHIQLRKHAA